jgi:hypothetical protein
MQGVHIDYKAVDGLVFNERLCYARLLSLLLLMPLSRCGTPGILTVMLSIKNEKDVLLELSSHIEIEHLGHLL